MNEINCESQEIKPKVSKLAIASFLIPVISIIGSYGFILAIQHDSELTLLLWLFFALPFLPFICFFLGIWSLIKTICNRGILKDYAFAFLGILLSVLAFFCSQKAIGSHRPEAHLKHCQYNMTKLYEAITSYGKSHNNKYPTSDKWCDMLVNNSNLNKSLLYSENLSENRKSPHKCSYAINPNAEPNSAGDVVLLFETKDGWNQSGGQELMSFDNHYRKGCNVLFNDGHVEFISPKKKDKLNWGNKKKDSYK